MPKEHLIADKERRRPKGAALDGFFSIGAQHGLGFRIRSKRPERIGIEAFCSERLLE